MSGASNSRAVRVLSVFEFKPSKDWMLGSLMEALRAREPGLQFRSVDGLFATYKPGGLRPERLINLLWIYLASPAYLVFSRYDAVLVRTSPPGVQVWVALWARLRRKPVICWLMDYHPEIEARILERRGWGALARPLRRLDAAAMRRFAVIVALDRAMARVARERAPAVAVLEHPTWGADGASPTDPVSHAPGSDSHVLRIAYSGNLGKAHDLAPFARFLGLLVQRRKVELYAGASAEGNRRLEALGASLGIPVASRTERLSWEALRALYTAQHIDLGVVLMSDDAAGLLSPSKFSGYINFGIPLLYFGPEETNAADVCVRFGGGFRLPNGAGEEAMAAVVDALLDPVRMGEAAAGALAAARHFARMNQVTLAAMVAPHLTISTP